MAHFSSSSRCLYCSLTASLLYFISYIKELFIQEFESRNALEKEDIRKKIAEKKRQADKVEKSLPKKKATLEKEAQREIDEFEKQFEINPILLVNIVLKF